MAVSLIARYLFKIRRTISGTIYLGRALVEWTFIFVNSLYGSITLLWPLEILLILVCVCGNLVKRSRIVTISKWIYALFVLYAIDALTHWMAFLYYAGVVYIVIYGFFSIAPGLVVKKTGVFRLKWYHGVMVGLIGTLFVESNLLILKPGPFTCNSMRSNSNITFLVDRNEFPDWYTLPRFLAMDPQEKTLFIGYRYSLNFSKTKRKANQSMIVVDRQTGDAKVAELESWEVIGMAFDPHMDSLAAVVVLQSPPLVPQPYHACLVWINRMGEVIHRIPLEYVDRFDYYCVVLPMADDIRIFDERAFLQVYTRDGSLVSRRIVYKGFYPGIVNSLVSNNRLYMCYGCSLLNCLFHEGLAVFELPDLKKTHSTMQFRFGTYAISIDGLKDEVYTNSQWSGTISVFDADLNPVREIRLGNVIRSIALDSHRRRGYAPLYTQGDLVAFDMDSGKVIGSIKIGKGGRTLYVTRRGEVIAGTGCGIVQVDPAAFE
jgi:hypothetical protein